MYTFFSFVKTVADHTCLRVPEFKVAVIGGAEELGSSVVVANVPNCFAVA